MSSNREELKRKGKSAFTQDMHNFGDLSSMQRERFLTQMNTIGSKSEMRRFDASLRDADSGMLKTL